MAARQLAGPPQRLHLLRREPATLSPFLPASCGPAIAPNRMASLTPPLRSAATLPRTSTRVGAGLHSARGTTAAGRRQEAGKQQAATAAPGCTCCAHSRLAGPGKLAHLPFFSPLLTNRCCSRAGEQGQRRVPPPQPLGGAIHRHRRPRHLVRRRRLGRGLHGPTWLRLPLCQLPGARQVLGSYRAASFHASQL